MSQQGAGGGGGGEGELATTSLECEFQLQFPCCSLLTELSDFLQSVRSIKDCEMLQALKIRARGNDIITYVISTNKHFKSTF